MRGHEERALDLVFGRTGGRTRSDKRPQDRRGRSIPRESGHIRDRNGHRTYLDRSTGE